MIFRNINLFESQKHDIKEMLITKKNYQSTCE